MKQIYKLHIEDEMKKKWSADSQRSRVASPNSQPFAT